MKLFTIEHIHRWENGHDHDRDLLVEIYKELKLINKQNQQNMSKFADIKTAFDELKTAVTEERTQANQKLDELNTKIDELTTNLNEGGTVEERNALLADVKSLATEVKSIIPDPVVDPIPDAPIEG
jgi:septation ring formation regulator EzrA